MIKVIKNKENCVFQCEECKYVYQDKSWSEKCEEWCKEHKSCNLEIIQHGEPPKKEK